MPNLLGPDGFIHLLPASYYDSTDPDGVRLWAYKHRSMAEELEWERREWRSLAALARVMHYLHERSNQEWHELRVQRSRETRLPKGGSA